MIIQKKEEYTETGTKTRKLFPHSSPDLPVPIADSRIVNDTIIQNVETIHIKLAMIDGAIWLRNKIDVAQICT